MRLGSRAILLAILGAIAGGLLLNLMPCVFPILAIKALHLARSGGEAGHARRDALAYAAGAIVGTGALGAALLAIRAGGTAAGWAFQLQDPRTTMLLLLLATAIALNLIGLFRLPALAGRARPSGGFATGALAAFVATPCAGPFLGAALGTALLLPPAGAVAVFAALGLGLSLPFWRLDSSRRCARACRSRSVDARLQRFLAIPDGRDGGCLPVAAVSASGNARAARGLVANGRAGGALAWVGLRQRKGHRQHWQHSWRSGRARAAIIWVPKPTVTEVRTPQGAERWSPAVVAAHLGEGRPVFVYFTRTGA